MCRVFRRLRAALLLAGTACLFSAASHADGYPDRGRAIDQIDAASDYSDLMAGRTRAVSIMRARAQGFVPSAALHDYVNGVLMHELAGVKLPPSFQPEVRILGAPEFTALCTPDGTVIVTVGLLEQLENEDELASVLGHEISHAIYRHHDSDWLTRTQYYAVVNGAAVDDVARQVGAGGGNLARGLDAAQHLYKLSANVIAPQMTRGQEDAADALGFDLMAKAGYDPEAALGLLDVLAEQEAEAARAATQAKASEESQSASEGNSSSSGGGLLGSLGGLSVGGLNVGGLALGGGHASSATWTDFALTVFDKVVDSLSDEASSHHPAKQREELLSAYVFREYRNLLPGNPTPLPWSAQNRSPLKAQLTPILSHYSAAEDAAAYVADATASTPARAQAAVQRAVANPTADHAYTEFVASEYFDGKHQGQLSEAALQKAVAGAEPSWEVYARLTDIYVMRNDFPHARALMDSAVQRFDNSPVLLPKRIQILHAMGDEAGVAKLLPECEAYDIRELYAECKKSAGR